MRGHRAHPQLLRANAGTPTLERVVISYALSNRDYVKEPRLVKCMCALSVVIQTRGIAVPCPSRRRRRRKIVHAPPPRLRHESTCVLIRSLSPLNADRESSEHGRNPRHPLPRRSDRQRACCARAAISAARRERRGQRSAGAALRPRRRGDRGRGADRGAARALGAALLRRDGRAALSPELADADERRHRPRHPRRLLRAPRRGHARFDHVDGPGSRDGAEVRRRDRIRSLPSARRRRADRLHSTAPPAGRSPSCATTTTSRGW